MSNGGDEFRKLMESLSVVEQGDNPSLLDAVKKAVKSAEVDADFHGLYIDLKKILRTYTSEPKPDNGIERLGIPQESVKEEQYHTDAEYEAFVETDADGDTYVILSASGHEIATMDYDVWKALVGNVESAMRKRM